MMTRMSSLCTLLNIEHPIIQSGMGRVAGPELAAEVSRAGGLGILAGLNVPAGTYTLWTIPRAKGTELIVNKQTGQWGTSYDGNLDLGKGLMTTETLPAPVEEFTISIVPADANHGTLTMAWGSFRWTAPLVLTAR